MLQIDPSIILVFAIVWILVLVLTKTVFNPIRRVMRDRDEGIRADREAGEQAEREYTDGLQKIEDDVKKARAAAKKIGKVEVNHGQTSCQTPDAVVYMDKTLEHRKNQAAKKNAARK